MGIFSVFSRASVEQKSHQPLDMTPELSQTLQQLGKDVKVMSTESAQSIPDSVAQFVRDRPLNMYVIDGERDVDQSIICTQVGPSKTCLKLKANSVELFRTMQRMDYFCSLPDDVNATYFECRKIQ